MHFLPVPDVKDGHAHPFYPKFNRTPIDGGTPNLYDLGTIKGHTAWEHLREINAKSFSLHYCMHPWPCGWQQGEISERRQMLRMVTMMRMDGRE